MAKVDYRRFIEDQFNIINKKNKEVPFILNDVQEKYYEMLQGNYGNSMEGVRDIVLKARQEGVSSFILALFTVDFINVANSVSICIAHRKNDTEKLFKKVKFYLDSYCDKNGWSVNDYLDTDNKGEIVNKTNNAEFYILTAGARVGGRGGTAKNILFSEAAYFGDTEKITAREIIEGTSQQVPLDYGMIFIESTANGYGNYYQKLWERASRGESIYKPRFFSWEEFYNDAWIEKKKLEFESEAMFNQEYPIDPKSAFISSGTPYFDMKVLEKLMNESPKPTEAGRLAQDGHWVTK